MVLQMSDIVTVPLTAGSSSSSSQPFRSVPCLQMQTAEPLKTEDPDAQVTADSWAEFPWAMKRRLMSRQKGGDA
jgi:hypothetical protein